MNVVVLAGSPKGSQSVTAEYVRYLAARRPEDTFTFLYPAQAYRKYERHPEALTEVLEAVAAADLVLWAFPLYFLLVSSGYKRFIEIVFEGDGGSTFRDRYTASLSTSIHFYDHTAHNYIHGVCDDLGMRYLGAFSAEMHDLLNTDTRAQLERWFAGIEGRIRRGDRPARRYAPLDFATVEYRPAETLSAPHRRPRFRHGPLFRRLRPRQLRPRPTPRRRGLSTHHDRDRRRLPQHHGDGGPIPPLLPVRGSSRSVDTPIRALHGMPQMRL